MSEERITLKIPVTIKATVTEELKKGLVAEMQDAIQKADAEVQQLDAHAKRMMVEQAKLDPHGLTSIRQQIDAEKQKRMDFKNNMLEKIKEVANLVIGSEVVQGTMERFVEVGVGDDLQALMVTEVLVEEGKIVAIRS